MTDWEQFLKQVPWFVQFGETVVVGDERPCTRGPVDGLPALSALLGSATLTPIDISGKSYELLAWGSRDARRGWLCLPPHETDLGQAPQAQQSFWKFCGGIVERFGEPGGWWLNQNDILTAAAADLRLANVLAEYAWMWEDAGLKVPLDADDFSVVAVEANGNLTLAHREDGRLLLFAPDHSFSGVTPLPGCPPSSLLTIDDVPDLETWIEVNARAWLSENSAVRVDPSNVEQLNAWNGAQGAFWVKRAERFDQGVAGYRDQFFAAAAIDATSNVLDIGCGNGQTTRDAARFATEGSVLGVDLSSSMVGLARSLAAKEQVPNVTFEQADAQIHPFPEAAFDVVISRHGSMFFGTPLAAFTNIARATRPGGRLVLLTWQPFQHNEWITTFRTIFAAGREFPFKDLALSDPAQIEELLTSAGYDDVRLQALNEPMYFGRDVDDAVDFLSEHFGGMIRDLDDRAREEIIETLCADLDEHQTDRGVFYGSAVWLIEARRP